MSSTLPITFDPSAITPEKRDELWADWLKALRSGEYEQCEGALHKPDVGYCCLGVACIVFQKHFPGVLEERPPSEGSKELITDFVSIIDQDEEQTVLPVIVRKAFDLKGQGGEFVTDFDNTSLLEMNDNGTSFRVIADVIERERENLKYSVSP